MEDFISRIIEIDKQAREMTVDMESLHAIADKQIDEQNKTVKAQIDKSTDAAVEKFRENEQKASAEKLSEKKKYYEQISEEFGKRADEYGDKWVADLVSRTVAQ